MYFKQDGFEFISVSSVFKIKVSAVRLCGMCVGTATDSGQRTTSLSGCVCPVCCVHSLAMADVLILTM